MTAPLPPSSRAEEVTTSVTSKVIQFSHGWVNQVHIVSTLCPHCVHMICIQTATASQANGVSVDILALRCCCRNKATIALRLTRTSQAVLQVFLGTTKHASIRKHPNTGHEMSSTACTNQHRHLSFYHSAATWFSPNRSHIALFTTVRFLFGSLIFT